MYVKLNTKNSINKAKAYGVPANEVAVKGQYLHGQNIRFNNSL